jgi:hypothetical protein
MRGPTIAPMLTKSRIAMSAPPAAFKSRIVVTPAAAAPQIGRVLVNISRTGNAADVR